MGDRQNYYILLELSPSVKDVASIEKAIKDKQAQWSGERNHPTKGVLAKQGLESLKYIRAVLIDDPQERDKEAEAAKEILLKQDRDKLADLRNQASVLLDENKISETDLKGLAKKFKDFSETEILKIINATVKKEEVLNYKDDDIQPLDSTVAKSIQDSLDIVKKKDLFEFLELVPTSSCPKLLEKANEIYNNARGTDADPTAKRALVGFCKDLFKDEKSKGRYQKTLRLEAFKDIYPLVDTAASGGVIDSKKYQNLINACADRGIKIDEAEFRIYEYCQKRKHKIVRSDNAEFKKQIQCGICGHLNDKAAVNCTNCGNPLKVKCPKCGKEAASSDRACSGCGFNIGDMPNARPLIRDAKIELSKKNFDQARDLLAEAESFDPKNPEIEKLKADLKREGSVIMFSKHYVAAEDALRKNDFASAHSFLYQARLADPDQIKKTGELELRINAEEQLSKAQVAFENAKKLSPSRQADECIAILQYCANFRPAISYLQSAKPESCKSITVGADNTVGCANISWPRSAEQGVSYRLVRKQGNTIPSNELDGEILADNTSDTSYRDKSILSGYNYSYAIFAIRYGVFSSGMGKTILLLADVTDVNAGQVGEIVRLSWTEPKNCVGVTVRRTVNGAETILSNSARGSFEDKDVKYGVTYSYKLCANYNNQPLSRGIDIVVTPSPKIDSFTITVAEKQGKDKLYKVSWNIKMPGIDLQILVNDKPVCKLKSEQGSCDLELPPDGFHTITAQAYSGGKWLGCENSPQINTYPPCPIDKKDSAFYEETGLHLKVEGLIPSNVAGFYYAVRTGDSKNRWPCTQDIGVAHDIDRISKTAYQKEGEILFNKTAREENAYYVSLFTIYSIDGKEVVSDPRTCRFERPLKANVFWKISKNLLGGLKLSVEFSGNRPFGRIPELILCTGNRHLLSHDDANAECLLKLPAVDLDSPQKTYNKTYDLNTGISARQLKDKKIFLFMGDTDPGENFTQRWAEGFKGKV